jgi:hypothetical protein
MQKEHSPVLGVKCGPKPHKPYTYLLKCLVDNTFYYGVKYEKGCHPDDFFITYETSSKEVKEKIKKYGKKAFSFEIRKTFNDCEKARLWENKVLRRLKVIKRDDFMNKTDNISIKPMYGSDNSMTRPEVIDSFKKSRAKNPTRKPSPREIYDKLSKLFKGKKRPKEVGEKISKSLKGYKHSNEFKEKCKKRATGVEQSDENKLKKSQSIKGRKRYTDGKKIIFRHPGKEPAGFYSI